MGWTETLLAALRLTKNNPTAAPPDNRAALLHNSSVEAAAVTVPDVTLTDLKNSTRSLSDKMLIGEGRYAMVYKLPLPNGMTVAAKSLKAPSAERWKASDAAFLVCQVSMASRLRHENLLRLLGYNVTANLRVLIYEFAPMGTLHDALHGPRGKAPQMVATLSWKHRVQIALDAAKGLAYLHEAGLMHHDVRSTNVLLFQGFRAKIADYDMFKQLPSKDVEIGYTVMPTHASLDYIPPELYNTGNVTQKSDVFSFGVVLLELLMGNKADKGKLKLVVNDGASVRFDPKLGRQYSRAESRKLATVALECLKEPASRPSMATVVREIQECLPARR